MFCNVSFDFAVEIEQRGFCVLLCVTAWEALILIAISRYVWVWGHCFGRTVIFCLCDCGFVYAICYFLFISVFCNDSSLQNLLK